MTLRHIFQRLELPVAYLQIADGSLSMVQSAIAYDKQGRARQFEFIAHCITKQGDWAMALSHRRVSKDTSVYWSVDHDTNSTLLLEEMHECLELCFHPLLLPCIMFATTVQKSQERRSAIKAKLQIIEQGAYTFSRDPTFTADADFWSNQYDSRFKLEHLFELLQSVRREQASREGRYQLWDSYHSALLEGLEYCDQVFSDSDSDRILSAHQELKQWIGLLWKKFESLKARDMDHVQRIKNLSKIVGRAPFTTTIPRLTFILFKLYNIMHLRNNRIQVDIARASQRDSEDMKFIAILGAVFLPASLVAVSLMRTTGYMSAQADNKKSILNVNEFVFLSGPKLFGVYLAITVPCAAILVTMLTARPSFQRWWTNKFKKP
jgi:hypothetical protein